VSIERLIDSLLWEGYALYPYTPAATKNSTPTPFGILYPPAYADGRWSFDHLELRCRLVEPGTVSAELHFLQPTGERHEAAARRIELQQGAVEVVLAPLRIWAALSVDGDRVTLRVENRTSAPYDLDRADALQLSLISTHPVLRIEGGRFLSPLESGLPSVNTYPVLASDGDDAIVGAAIILPDHPRLAPESLGGLFDSTEIEEALMLHVRVLSDEERSAITDGDPIVREMIERAESATQEDMLALHGRTTLRDPSQGEDSATVNGVTYRRGTKVVIRPGADADLHARMLDGHPATVERIFVDYDDKVYLGVTIDDDPGQELMRETNRFLFFFTPEVEVLA
jgi:hypothetical protein